MIVANPNISVAILTGRDGAVLTGRDGAVLTGRDGAVLTGRDGAVLTGGDGAVLTWGRFDCTPKKILNTFSLYITQIVTSSK